MFTLLDRPVLVGDGPATCSTSMQLVRFPEIIWDTNRYYGDLGVHPRATRKEIRNAYLQRKGYRSRRLSYVTKQLLHAPTRRKYDSTPLGSLFWDDYLSENLHVLRAQAASRLRAEGLHQEADEIEAMETISPLDTVDAEEQSDPPTATEVPVTPWPYSHYIWRTECQDQDRLRQWQGALVQILGSRREHHQIAVGFIAGQGCEVHRIGYRLVFFLGDEEQPTDALAMRAVSQLHHSLERIEIKK